MTDDPRARSLDLALTHVSRGRRGFLKVLIAGSMGLAAAPLMTTVALAKGNGNGKGKRKKGKGKGKHRGR